MGVTQNPQPSRRTTRKSFDALEGGAVGLRIVAAMGTPRSEPIAIVSRETSASKLVQMDSSYTCLVSHVGEASFRKRVCLEGQAGFGCQRAEEAVVFFQSPVRVVEPPPLLPVEGFLSHCSLCGKSLHGIDIFMYRGERAFCSAECRFQHMLGDEHHEKHCSSELMKPTVHMTTSVAAA